uniref:ATP-dependent metallopeptidase FtsH/Yme1/Tma family protein n=1 Tax=uncultured Arthrobacter sp. TaxID=114050 RepID=UPI0032172996
MKRFSRSGALVPILIVIVLAFFAQRLIAPSTEEDKPTYSEFIEMISTESGAAQIESVDIKTNDNTIDVVKDDGTEFSTGYPDNTEQQLVSTLEQQKIETSVQGKGGSGFLSLLTYILPFILILAFWIFLMNQMQGGGSRVMNFGKSRAKRMSVDAPKITFRDVAGADEAVQELHEIKEFLENPKKFQALGARIPKG